jgi:ABC-type phosphate transport system substrate-binding protein
MKLRTGIAVVLAVAAIGAAPAPVPRQSVAFVVAPGSHTGDLSSAELRRILLGQTTRWNDRHRIVLCLRPTDSPEGLLVLERLVRMTGIDYSQHWLGAVFRGDAPSVPRVFTTRAALVQAVAENPDAIGFLLAGEPVAPLRQITVDGKAAGDPGYPLAR